MIDRLRARSSSAASMTIPASAATASSVVATRRRPSAASASSAGSRASRARPSRIRSPRQVDRGRVDVVQDDLVTGRQDDLGDAGPHRPGTDDADDRHTGFIASNGWRQARQ